MQGDWLWNLTGREIRSEQSVPTFHLRAWLRARRLQWAGHLLRGEESSLVCAVAQGALGRHCRAGGSWGIFMDTPAGYTEEEVLELAQDRDGWRGMVEMLYKLKEPSRRRRQTAVRLQYEDKELDEEGAATEGDEVLVAVKPDGIDQRWNTKVVSKLA